MISKRGSPSNKAVDLSDPLSKSEDGFVYANENLL